jgi:hypothetical protein
MAVQAIMAGANMALAAAPLFFGENNLFSGKARQASRMLEQNFNRSQAMGIPQEMQNVAQQRAMRANQGLGSAAMGLYQQEANRGQASALSALGGRRSALAGIGNIVQSGQDSALRLAGMDEQARQQNRMLSEQTQMQVGEAKYQNELRKQQEAADYWGTRKAESNAAISGALKGIGQAAGTAMFTGAFNKSPVDPGSITNPTSSIAMKMGQGVQSVANSSTSSSTPGINIPGRLGGTPNLNQTSMFNMFNPGFKAPGLAPTRLTTNIGRSFPAPPIPSYIG